MGVPSREISLSKLTMTTVVIYDGDFYAHICASLLIEEVEGKDRVFRIPFQRGEKMKDVLKEKFLDVVKDSPPEVKIPRRVIAMGIGARINAEEIVETFPYSRIHLILPEGRELKSKKRDDVTIHVGAGTDVYEPLEEILSLKTSRLAILCYFMSKRNTTDLTDDVDNIYSFVFNSTTEKDPEKKIEATLKHPIDHIRREGQKSREEFMRGIKDAVSKGCLLDLNLDKKFGRISDHTGLTGEAREFKETKVWLSRSEGGPIDTVKYSSKHSCGDALLHMNVCTRGKKDRLYFTLWSSDKKVDAGKIAGVMGGGGSWECAGWDLSLEDAEKWISSVTVKKIESEKVEEESQGVEGEKVEGDTESERSKKRSELPVREVGSWWR